MILGQLKIRERQATFGAWSMVMHDSFKSISQGKPTGLWLSPLTLRHWPKWLGGSFRNAWLCTNTRRQTHQCVYVANTTHLVFTDADSKDSARSRHICGQIRQHGQCVLIPLDHGADYTVSRSPQGRSTTAFLEKVLLHSWGRGITHLQYVACRTNIDWVDT